MTLVKDVDDMDGSGAADASLGGSGSAVILRGPCRAPRGASRAMDADEVALVTLEALRERHRDLDTAIEALAHRGSDPLTVRRLKKRKLLLRDRIAALEDRMTPDIIA